jgi:CBS domain
MAIHESPQAKDFMQRHVHSVTPDVPLAEIVALLLKHEISNVPVVQTEKGRSILVGFISERDCLEHLSNEAFYGSPMPPQTAGTVMRKHPVCVGPDTELFYAGLNLRAPWLPASAGRRERQSPAGPGQPARYSEGARPLLCAGFAGARPRALSAECPRTDPPPVPDEGTVSGSKATNTTIRRAGSECGGMSSDQPAEADPILRTTRGDSLSGLPPRCQRLVWTSHGVR